ncbi:MAG: hypothetical protein V9G12_17760 [Microthrixaceae bacterium]
MLSTPGSTPSPPPTAPGAAQRASRAALEGLACIERWGYEIVGELGASLDGTVSTAGVGARHPRWMQLRARFFLGRPVNPPQRPESGFGAALVAAINVWYDGNWDATSRLVVESFRCEPRPGQRSRCETISGVPRRLRAAPPLTEYKPCPPTPRSGSATSADPAATR